MKTPDRVVLRSARRAVRCAGAGLACLSLIFFNSGTSGAAPSGMTTTSTSDSGALDSSFGTRGKVITDFGLNRIESGRAVAAITDGRGELQSIVAAGCISGGSSDFDRDCSRFSGGAFAFLLARYTPSGALDGTFGDDGKVITYFRYSAGARDVAVAADGKILAVGGAYACLAPLVDAICRYSFALVRYLGNGALDPSFGDSGKVVTHPILFGADNMSASAVVLQADGKILVAGEVQKGGRQDFAIARYLSDGGLDPTFGGGTGFVTTDFDGAADAADDIVVQDDQYIVVGGSSAVFEINVGVKVDFALARYTPSGLPDASFGEGGKVVTTSFGRSGNITFFDGIRELALSGSGDSRKIVAVGTAGFCRERGCSASDFALARYNLDGSLETAVTTDLRGTDAARALVIDPAGRMVVGGFTCDARECADPQFALVRYRSDGSLDGSFGSEGIVETDFGDDDSVTSLLRQPDGRIVAAGYGGPARDFALARYLP